MIYFDHNATTPLDERVLAAMQPYLERFYGNPSGLYRLGRMSRSAIDTAREQVAALVGSEPDEVIFTSGGTESNNTAIKGLGYCGQRKLLATGATEHPSVSESANFMARQGCELVIIPVDGQGLPDCHQVEQLDAQRLRCVSVMLANNETGVIHPVAELAAITRDKSAFFHCDAVQAAGKIPVNFRALGVQLMSLSSHKIYGPKGVGALVVDRRIECEPLLHGGGQESQLRGGTESVAGIVGFGKAAELARAELDERCKHLLALRQQLEEGLRDLPGVRLFAEDASRLPNTLQFGMHGFDGETVVMALDRKGFAVSSGSACAAGAGEPSPVLVAMGVAAAEAKSAVRVSFGRGNTAADVAHLLTSLRAMLDAQRSSLR